MSTALGIASFQGFYRIKEAGKSPRAAGGNPLIPPLFSQGQSILCLRRPEGIVILRFELMISPIANEVTVFLHPSWIIILPSCAKKRSSKVCMFCNKIADCKLRQTGVPEPFANPSVVFEIP